MEIGYTDEALKDISYWKKSGDKIIQNKIQKLIIAIQENPTEGIGKPEEGGRQAEDQCAEEGEGGDFQRDPETLEEWSGRPCAAIRREEKTGDAVPLPVVAHLPGSQDQNPNGETRQQEKLPAVDQGCP